MQPVSANFLAALRSPHSIATRVEAWRGGARVGGTLAVLSGQVTADAGNNTISRTLSVELAPAQGLWDALAPAGTTLVAYRGVRFVDGTTELVRLGTFDVDEQSFGYSPDAGLSITAPDVFVRVTRARFEKPRTTNGSALTSAAALAAEAVGYGTGTIAGDTTTQTRGAVWERDREEAVTTLAESAGAWVYTAADGLITTRAVPSLTQTPVWTVDASASGVLLSADRTRSRQRTYNVVVVSAGDTDGTTPFTPVTVADTDPASPTYTGGPFGRVPYFYTSQLLTTTAQATAAGKALLRQVTGLAAQLEVTSVVNPALEPGDAIQVLLPPRAGDLAEVERHLIDSVTIPLTAEGTQSIRTRSTRPEGDVPQDGTA